MACLLLLQQLLSPENLLYIPPLCWMTDGGNNTVRYRVAHEEAMSADFAAHDGEEVKARLCRFH